MVRIHFDGNAWTSLRYAIILNQFWDSKNYINITIFAISGNESLRSNRTQTNTHRHESTLLNH